MLANLDTRREELERLLDVAANQQGEVIASYLHFIHDLIIEIPEKPLRGLMSNSRASLRGCIEDAGQASMLSAALASETPAIVSTGLPLSAFHARVFDLIKGSVNQTAGPDHNPADPTHTDAQALRGILHDVVSVAPDDSIAATLSNAASLIGRYLRAQKHNDLADAVWSAFTPDIAARQHRNIRKILTFTAPESLKLLDALEAHADQDSDYRASLNEYYCQGGRLSVRDIVKGGVPNLGQALNGEKTMAKLVLNITQASEKARQPEYMSRYNRMHDVLYVLEALGSHQDENVTALTSAVVHSAHNFNGFHAAFIGALGAKDEGALIDVVTNRFGPAVNGDEIKTFASVACGAMLARNELKSEVEMSR